MNQGSVVTALPGTTQGDCEEIEGTVEELECATSEEETWVNSSLAVTVLPGASDREPGDPDSEGMQAHQETASTEELVDKTWSRTDQGVKRFVASKDGGPRWEK
eukprot:503286-Amphidinium_carterae.1